MAEAASLIHTSKSYDEVPMGEEPLTSSASHSTTKVSDAFESQSVGDANLNPETLADTGTTTTTSDLTGTAATTTTTTTATLRASTSVSSSKPSATAAATTSTGDDIELRVAKEMALAIQQNPNLTPSELKELMNKVHDARVPPGKTSSLRSSGKSPLLKQFSKGVKSSVKKAFQATVPERKSSSSSTHHPLTPTSATAAAAAAGGNQSPKGFSNATTSSSSVNTVAATAASIPPLSAQISSLLSSSTSSSAAAAAAERGSLTPSERGGMRLGDFLESAGVYSGRTSALDHSETDDTQGGITAVTGGGNAGKIRITGIVWKRRSGLGKYSTTAAWERRRVVLKGSTLYYYRTDVDTKDEEMAAAATEGAADEEGQGSPTAGEHTTRSKSWFMEQMGATKSSSTKKEARGYLDLVKENASVGASSGHSGAPTPYALSIKILTQTKWKLCFDTHAQLMQWLAAMTDVIVQGSVDTYNSQILAANDPNKAVGDLSSYLPMGQLSEPPPIARSSAGGHRLWGAGHYKVQSENYPAEELEDVSENDLEDVHSEDEEDVEVRNKKNTVVTPDGSSLVLELDGGRLVWGIADEHIWRWGLLWNATIFLSRTNSVTTESFWYILTFANIALFCLLTKETVGGTVKPNVAMSRRLARRLSNGLGVPITSNTKAGGQPTGRKTDTAGAASTAVTVPATKYKPVAGTTCMRIKNATDLPVNKDGVVFAGWRFADPTMMMIRSHNYKKDKVKVPSPGELYKCVHVDIFESRCTYPDIANRVQLPKVEFKDDGPKTWNAPDIFVVSIQIPTDPPKMYNASVNGGGYTVTIYFVMHQDTRDILKRVTADGYDPKQEKQNDINTSKVNAVRLLDEWCRRAPTDDAFCARFKVLPNAQNLKEIGMPNWIARYNCKPFLIKRPGETGFLYKHPDKSCMEFDISLHPFPYLAKQGICFMKDTFFKKVLITFGFLIEGRAEDELPECLIGLMQLCYPDPIHAIQGEDFMAGTSPKSFE